MEKTKFEQIEQTRSKRSEVEAEIKLNGRLKNAEKTKFDQIEWTRPKNDCIGEKCEDEIEPTRLKKCGEDEMYNKTK